MPLSGPISAFAFLNTLQALEDLPFAEGMMKGARLYGCQPFLSEDRYREKLARGRIRVDDLAAVVRKELGSRANETISGLGTRWELRLAMLQYPLRFGPPEELLWFVTATDALQRFREEARRSVRARFIDETQHWVMRDLREPSRRGGSHSTPAADSSQQSLLADIMERFDESTIETWPEETWEALRCKFCGAFVATACGRSNRWTSPSLFQNPASRVLQDAVGEDSDELVHELLIRFLRRFHRSRICGLATPQPRSGFLSSVLTLYGEPCKAPDSWMRELAAELTRLDEAGTGTAGIGRRIARTAGRQRCGTRRLCHSQHVGVARLGRHALAHGNSPRPGAVCGAGRNDGGISGRALDRRARCADFDRA